MSAQDMYAGFAMTGNLGKSAVLGEYNTIQRNVRSAISDLYANDPNPSMEKIRDQYAHYGDVPGMERMNQKIYLRDFEVANNKVSIFSKQLDFAMKMGDNNTIATIQSQINQDPDVGKFYQGIEINPVAREVKFTASNTFEGAMPDGSRGLVKPGDIYGGFLDPKTGKFVPSIFDNSKRMQLENNLVKQTNKAKTSPSMMGGNPVAQNIYAVLQGQPDKKTRKQLWAQVSGTPGYNQLPPDVKMMLAQRVEKDLLQQGNLSTTMGDVQGLKMGKTDEPGDNAE